MFKKKHPHQYEHAQDNCDDCGRRIKGASVMFVVFLSGLLVINVVMGLGNLTFEKEDGVFVGGESDRMVLGVLHEREQDVQDEKVSSEEAKEKIIMWIRDENYDPKENVKRGDYTRVVMDVRNENTGGFDCFADKEKKWFTKAVCDAKQMNFVEGYSDGTFKAEKDINLAEALKVAAEASDVELDDVDGEWYQKYMDHAESMGVFEKVSSDPKHIVTGEEAGQIIDVYLVQN